MLTDDWSPRRWRVALVAHDAKKTALVAFVQRHRAHFKDWELLATASTGEAVRDATGLRVRTVLAGPRGGDVQIGAEMAAGEIDALIFLRDPLTVHPHEPDSRGAPARRGRAQRGARDEPGGCRVPGARAQPRRSALDSGLDVRSGMPPRAPTLERAGAWPPHAGASPRGTGRSNEKPCPPDPGGRPS